MAGSAFEKIVGDFAKAAASLTESLASSWLRIDGAQLDDKSGPVAFLTAHLQWITSWFAVLSLILTAGHMAWTRRASAGREALRGVLTLVIVSSAGVGIFNALMFAGDRFSTWIVARAINCQPTTDYTYTPDCGHKFGNMLNGAVAFNAVSGGALLLIASLLIIFAVVVQLFLLLIQKAALPVLAGTLPLSAGASSTPWGNQWFRKSAGLMVALTCYKPAAAICYAAAFYQINSGDGGGGKKGDMVTILTGVVLMLLAILVLPALMRVAIPASEAAGGGGGGHATVGSVGGAVATGAIAIQTGGTSAVGQAAARGATQAVVSGARSVATTGGGVPGQGRGPTGGNGPSGAPTGGGRPGGGDTHQGENSPGPGSVPTGANANTSGNAPAQPPASGSQTSQNPEGPRGSR
ncbi:hypothetical protein ACIQU6_30890 [Streptomyces sp. NPDC090442]|uniref:hypothetical protein n=1 Tax=Streptomyces sp. NPDC090442 TaxID=3365962 RepID=UPI00380D0DF6